VTEQTIIPGLPFFDDESFPPSITVKLYEYINANLYNVTLEDIFTIIDKAIVTGESVHCYNTHDLYKLRESLFLCILRVFTVETLRHAFNSESYKKYSHHLLNLKQTEPDPVAIISLNWDSILDTYLYNEITQGGFQAGIDYCIYDYDYVCCLNSQEWCPSTHLKQKGLLNIKLLKIHGGLNWIICSNCHRLFYSYKENIGLEQFFKDFAVCPYCSNCYGDLGGNKASIKLQCNLGTPTMLKNLDDVNLRNIWKNAFVELTEAEKVVFIGYSFPQADYEFRCLLKRALNPRAQIEVVLAPGDNPIVYGIIANEEIRNKIIDLLPSRRFDSFFGKDKIKYYYGGFESYVDML
jgi:hypothetical protein